MIKYFDDEILNPLTLIVVSEELSILKLQSHKIPKISQYYILYR